MSVCINKQQASSYIYTEMACCVSSIPNKLTLHYHVKSKQGFHCACFVLVGRRAEVNLLPWRLGMSRGPASVRLLDFSSFRPLNRSLNVQKCHFCSQKSTPGGIYCLRKVIHTSPVRLYVSIWHCPLSCSSGMGNRGSQRIDTRIIDRCAAVCAKCKPPMGTENSVQ